LTVDPFELPASRSNATRDPLGQKKTAMPMTWYWSGAMASLRSIPAIRRP